MDRYEVTRNEWMCGGLTPIGDYAESVLWSYVDGCGCCLGHIGRQLGVHMRASAMTLHDGTEREGNYYYPQPETPEWPRGLFLDMGEDIREDVQDILASHGIKPAMSRQDLARVMAYVNDTTSDTDSQPITREAREACLTELAALGGMELVFVDAKGDRRV